MLSVTVLMLLLTGCEATGGPTVVTGRAVSMLYNPGRVGGLPVSDGPTGPRGELPTDTSQVAGSDGGEIDRLALASVDDIRTYWAKNYGSPLRGTFKPVSKLVSWDALDPDGPTVCGHPGYRFLNAMFCPRVNTMAWERAKFMPTIKKYFGPMAITGTIAHEYGHAIQHMSHLVNRLTPTLVSEQQADCFAGVYLQWVAAGNSEKFQLDTGDGLNHVIAAVILSRDPISTEDSPLPESGDEHGTALDRVGAFQIGFDGGTDMCAKIDKKEIKNRRGALPAALFDATTPQSDAVLDEPLLNQVMGQLGTIFNPKNAPTLSTSTAACGDGHQPDPVAYCADSNTLLVDLPGLQKLSEPSNEQGLEMPQGDNTGLSAFTSRYVLAVEAERGVSLKGATAGLRTACLTGVAQRRMTEKTDNDKDLMLGGGDLDEAVTGLLMNGLAASDIEGNTVPAGFTRILAFRSGLNSEVDECFTRFP